MRCRRPRLSKVLHEAIKQITQIPAHSDTKKIFVLTASILNRILEGKITGAGFSQHGRPSVAQPTASIYWMEPKAVTLTMESDPINSILSWTTNCCCLTPVPKFLHICIILLPGNIKLLLYPFNGLFSGTTSVSRHQRNKPFWILEQEMMGWQWHQLDHMQIICTSLQTDNHTRTSPLSFYRPDVLPAAQPTASKHWSNIKLLTKQ